MDHKETDQILSFLLDKAGSSSELSAVIHRDGAPFSPEVCESLTEACQASCSTSTSLVSMVYTRLSSVVLTRSSGFTLTNAIMMSFVSVTCFSLF